MSDVVTPGQLRAAFTPVHTSRLLLRAVAENHVDALFAIHGDPATYRFHPGGVTRSRAQAAARVAGWQREWTDLGFGVWAVSRAAEEPVIGFGGLTRQVFRRRPVLNTYYRFDPSAWGRGYATEMAGAALGLAQRAAARHAGDRPHASGERGRAGRGREARTDASARARRSHADLREPLGSGRGRVLADAAGAAAAAGSAGVFEPRRPLARDVAWFPPAGGGNRATGRADVGDGSKTPPGPPEAAAGRAGLHHPPRITTAQRDP